MAPVGSRVLGICLALALRARGRGRRNYDGLVGVGERR
jgi:hypothetical protein